MSPKILLALRLVAAALFVWMLGLYWVGPSRTYYSEVSGDAATFTVRCRSLAQEGWRNSPSYLDVEGGIRLTYLVTDGEEPEPGVNSEPLSVSRELNATCDQARTHRAAAIGLLGAPTAVVGALALLLRRRDPSEQPPEPAAESTT